MIKRNMFFPFLTIMFFGGSIEEENNKLKMKLKK